MSRMVDLDALIDRLEESWQNLEAEVLDAETPEDRIRTEGAAGGVCWAITLAKHVYASGS